jgi:hypothetical protein
MKEPVPVPSSTVVALGGRRYLLRPKPSVGLEKEILSLSPQLIPGEDAIKPTLVLSVDTASCSAEGIVEKIQSFEAKDDVFCTDFLADTLILQSSPIPDAELHQLKANLEGIKILGLSSWRLKSLLLLSPSSDLEPIPCGPYFLHQNQIFEAWKLYDDNLSAFQTCVVADPALPYR